MTTLTAPTTRRSAGTVRLAPEGEIDLASSGTLERAIMTALIAEPRPNTLVIDLSGVGFCDCSGVRVLLQGRAAARTAGTAYQVINAHGVVLRILRLLGLDEVLLAGGAGTGGAAQPW